MLRLLRRYRFSASHLYRRPEWSEDENRRRFGKCANLPGHGHNYRLWLAVEGEPDATTGFVADLGWLDQTVQSTSSTCWTTSTESRRARVRRRQAGAEQRERRPLDSRSTDPGASGRSRLVSCDWTRTRTWARSGWRP
jgi:hypothetical protein